VIPKALHAEYNHTAVTFTAVKLQQKQT